jgi:hypothetical protein
MLLKDLQIGDLFQFRNNSGPAIYRAVNGAAGLFSQVGQFNAGAPRPFCSVPGCERHPKVIADRTERPNRAVRKITFSVDYAPTWSETPEGIHKALDTLALYDAQLAALRSERA